MPLDQQRCELILTRMKSLDMETKLRAITEARGMYAQLFLPGQDDSQWAYSAFVVQSFYNIIRDELQIKLIAARKGFAETEKETKAKPKETKPKKAKPEPIDPTKMMAAFLEMKAQGKLG